MSDKKGVFDIKKANESITKYAPEISFWVAAILILAGEIRVLDVVFTLTGSWFLAASALGVSGVMFFVWKNNWQYPIATTIQTNISLVGMVVSLGIAVWIGGLDYYVQAGILPANLDAPATVINSLIYGTVGNIVSLLLYWYKDPRVESIRAKINGEEEFKWLEESTNRANTMLDKVIPLMDKYQGMVKKYGKRAADDMLIKAGIDPETFKNIIDALEDKTGKDLNGDGRIGRVSYAAPTIRPESLREDRPEPKWTIEKLVDLSGFTVEQMRKEYTNFQEFKRLCVENGVPENQIGQLWGKVGNFQNRPGSK
jgi:hypothetical protein